MAVAVRAGELADLPVLTAIYNHYVEHTAITFDLTPFSVEQREKWFTRYAVTGPHRLLVADTNETVVGYATSSRFRDKAAYDTSVETTVYLDPAAHGTGIGSLLYSSLFAALEHEDVHRAYAGIALPNDPSLALHRRFGFTEVGTFAEVGRKFGRYWDVVWLQRSMH